DPYAAPAPARPYLTDVGADAGRLRIAFTKRSPNGARVGADSLGLLDEITKLCAELGHHVEEADPAVDGEQIVPTFLTVSAANTVVNAEGHPTKGRAPTKDEVERVTWAMYDRGLRVTGAEYVRATQTMHRIGRQMAAFHKRHDVLLTP